MDWISWLVLTCVWILLFGAFFLASREGHGKCKYSNMPNGPYQDNAKEMKFFAWMILLTPIWPIVSIVVIGYFITGFLIDVIHTAKGVF